MFQTKFVLNYVLKTVKRLPVTQEIGYFNWNTLYIIAFLFYFENLNKLHKDLKNVLSLSFDV